MALTVPAQKSHPSQLGARPSQSARPSQRERQRAETRERIFQAALAEFRKVGTDAAQIPRIAEAAGVVRGTFYFHFPSKAHVLLELRDHVQNEMVETLRALRTEDAPLDAALAALFETTRSTAAELGEWHLLADLIGILVKMQMRGEVEQDSALLAELTLHFAAAIRRGELRAGAAPEPLARLVLNSMFGLVSAPPTDGLDLAAEFALLKDVFLRGMGKGGA